MGPRCYITVTYPSVVLNRLRSQVKGPIALVGCAVSRGLSGMLGAASGMLSIALVAPDTDLGALDCVATDEVLDRI